jgi:cytochrome c oxidase subunit 1
VFKAIRGGEKATDQVWEGARGLEWTLSSPPPYHSFETPPEISDQVVAYYPPLEGAQGAR